VLTLAAAWALTSAPAVQLALKRKAGFVSVAVDRAAEKTHFVPRGVDAATELYTDPTRVAVPRDGYDCGSDSEPESRSLSGFA